MYCESNDHKYLGCLIDGYLKNEFNLALDPAQLEVLIKMAAYDNVLFNHGRAVGATFMLATLAAILQSINPDINMVVASESIRQAEMINTEFKQKFVTWDFKPLNIVTIEEALSGEYDVLLLDEMTNISKKHADLLVERIKNKYASKSVVVCSGYRTYFNIASVATCMYSDDNSIAITKCYEDMPDGFFSLKNIEEIKTMFEYEEEFNMEYKGYII